MDTKEYTVTEHAGPYVAGRRAKKDATVELTEAQASSELLSGAIVAKGREAPSFEGSKRLAGIQANAKGFDTPEEAEQAEQAPPQDPPNDPPASSKSGGRKPAAAPEA